MDYEKECNEMMLHLGKNYTADNFAALIQAFSMSVARTIALIENHGDMHDAIQGLSQAMHQEACAEHLRLHPSQDQVIDHETFLRDVFKPECTND